jgi:hypothetical protein
MAALYSGKRNPETDSYQSLSPGRTSFLIWTALTRVGACRRVRTTGGIPSRCQATMSFRSPVLQTASRIDCDGPFGSPHDDIALIREATETALRGSTQNSSSRNSRIRVERDPGGSGGKLPAVTGGTTKSAVRVISAAGFPVTNAQRLLSVRNRCRTNFDPPRSLRAAVFRRGDFAARLPVFALNRGQRQHTGLLCAAVRGKHERRKTAQERPTNHRFD